MEQDATPPDADTEGPRRRKLTRVRVIGLAIVAVTVPSVIATDSYKIPAGSMAPTLEVGDHIVTNALAYGLRLPFGDFTIAASGPARGEVVVFRYPLDESEDFIKRVIALPGDELRMEGNELFLRREGETEFEALAREPTGEPCRSNGGETVPRCEVFRESLDGRTYLVRYMRRIDELEDFEPSVRTFEVPADHFFVLGDNRSQSHDSPQWLVELPDGSYESRPFVPFANLKGRAARIWLPPARFWTEIR